ncbi:salicylate synthase [Actinokineospora globicatena]|uniref:Salicylate synthase n=1 Tax=Actinokineospora globicatena TaxID=103729 RepID=A0A9W6V873_9PSEU|nr:salicylate synthase [Actinokineospora globicatena]GLW90664.1 salicylate synthase [Actinokineospora globicatena]
MTASRELAPTRLIEVPVDPLLAVAAVARLARPPFVVYERAGTWVLAAGARVRLRMDGTGIAVTTPAGQRRVPLTAQPLRQVAEVLAEAGTEPWRAYGWAAFELARLLHLGHADGPLLDLVVPAYELVIGPDGVREHGTAPEGVAEAMRAAASQSWPGPAADLTDPDALDEDYLTAVRATVRDIQAGDADKVILSRVVPVDGEIDFPATYVAGRRGNTPARSFLLDLGGLRATGFSPETVVEVDPAGRVSTRPLAGTRALVGDPDLDLATRRELLGDPKEIFEHAISVKLAQDELAAVCAPDSVRVEEFMTVRERGSVQHLASRVRGELADGRTAWDAFAALFPSITASGIPKAAAVSAIGRNEPRRGLYSGAVLTVDSDGALDAALVLRTVFSAGGQTWLRAGAGVIALSTPEREWTETCEKLRSISRFLVPAQVRGAAG